MGSSVNSHDFSYKGNFSVLDFLDDLAKRYNGSLKNNILTIEHDAFDLQVKYFEWIKGIKVTVNTISFYEKAQINYQTDQNDSNLYFSFYPQVNINRKNWNDKSVLQNSKSPIVLIERNIGTVSLEFESQEQREWITIEVPSQYFDNINYQDIFSISKYLNENSYAYMELIPFEINKELYQLINYKKEKSLEASYITYRLLDLINHFLFLIHNREEQEIKMNPDDIQRIIKVEGEITKDASKLPYLPSLCEKFGLSETKLQKDFKLMYGTTVYKYFQNYRLETTKQLLSESQLSITQIALNSGFPSLKKYSSAFKEKYNISPSEFRKNENTFTS